MDIYLTIAAFLLLIAAAAYVIHRLNSQHAERIAVHRYSSLLPSRRHGHNTARPPPSRTRPRRRGPTDATTATEAAAASRRAATGAAPPTTRGEPSGHSPSSTGGSQEPRHTP